MRTTDTLAESSRQTEKHNRLGKKVGFGLGALLVAAGAGTAYANSEAAHGMIADVADVAPVGSDLAARAKAVSEGPIITSYDVDALGKLTKRAAPGETPNYVQSQLDRVNDSLFGTDSGIAIAGLGAAIMVAAGSKLARRKQG